jgi:hypothetical protein
MSSATVAAPAAETKENGKPKAAPKSLPPERIIALIVGESGVGKSFLVACLRNALIYDTDIGGGLSYADARILRNNSERIPTGSYVEILDDLRRRHQRGQLKDRVTLAIDHVSGLQQEAALRHNPNLERDFGRSNDVATREWRKIREFCRNQDFNLIVTAHMKAKWENEKAVGIQADGAKNIEGDMSIVLQVRRGAGYPSTAWVQKWRRDPEDPRGIIPATFPLTIQAFEDLAGSGMLAPRAPVKLATEEQVAKLTGLLEVAKLPEGTVDKWLKKAGAETFADMPADAVDKCISFIQTTLSNAANGGEKGK